MAITIPFGAGVVAALIFLLFEFLVLPVMLHATSTLASFFLARRAAKGKTIHVRTINYPLWNEGLFNRDLSHALLFLIRILCISIPVYLETRFISHSAPIPVSRLIRTAYVHKPQYEDLILSEAMKKFALNKSDFRILALPFEVFARCAEEDEERWMNAKVANVVKANNFTEIRCVRGSEKAQYRFMERIPPFVEQSVLVPWIDMENSAYANLVYRTNLTLKIQMKEGPYQKLRMESGLKQKVLDKFYKDTPALLLKDVTVQDTGDMECFSWRGPLLEVLIRDKIRAHSFVCQNVTGLVVDFYFTSIEGLTNESNTRILAREKDVVSKLVVVSTSFHFLGSLEFKDSVSINAGHVVRQFAYLPPPTSFYLKYVLRGLCYTPASNVTVTVPGREEAFSVELDNVVIVVLALEVGLVLVLGLSLEVFARYRWNDMQRANTVEGLSYIWAKYIARWGGLVEKQSRITLRLCRRMFDGEERFVYHPELMGVEVLQGKDEEECSS